MKLSSDHLALIGVLSGSMADITDAPPTPKNLNRQIKRRFICSTEVGINFFTPAEDYRDFINDPPRYGQRIEFKK
jgi:hypothetical protein